MKEKFKKPTFAFWIFLVVLLGIGNFSMKYLPFLTNGKEELVKVVDIKKDRQKGGSYIYRHTVYGTKDYELSLRKELEIRSEIRVLVLPEKPSPRPTAVLGKSEDSFFVLIYKNEDTLFMRVIALFLLVGVLRLCMFGYRMINPNK